MNEIADALKSDARQAEHLRKIMQEQTAYGELKKLYIDTKIAYLKAYGWVFEDGLFMYCEDYELYEHTMDEIFILSDGTISFPAHIMDIEGHIKLVEGQEDIAKYYADRALERLKKTHKDANPHAGSSFDSFLEEEGIRQECEAVALDKLSKEVGGKVERITNLNDIIK